VQSGAWFCRSRLGRGPPTSPPPPHDPAPPLLSVDGKAPLMPRDPRYRPHEAMPSPPPHTQILEEAATPPPFLAPSPSARDARPPHTMHPPRRQCKFSIVYLFILQLLISFVFSTCAYSNHYHLVKCYYLLFELCSGFFAGSALVCINLTWSPSKILFCNMPLMMLLSRIHCIHCCCLGHTRIYIFPYS
jgi:hypothetical protein